MKLEFKAIKLVVILLLVFACDLSNKKDNKVESKPPVIVSDGVEIAYDSYGDGDYAIVFIHGWCINRSYWSNQIEELKSDFRVVAMDLPGFGDSGKNRSKWSIEKYGEDVNKLIEELQLSNVILVGHSMGGDVVLEATLKNNEVVGLIGVDNFKQVKVELLEEEKKEVDDFVNVLQNNFSEIVPAFAEGFLFHSGTSEDVKKRIIGDFLNNDSIKATEILKAVFEYADNETSQLSMLKQPIYLINSSATPTNIEGLDDIGINYSLLDIGETGHYPMLEKPKDFNDLIKNAISEIIGISDLDL